MNKITHKERKNIVRACKRKKEWYDGEAAQDKLIEAECIKRGFTFSGFFAENGQTLNKILC